MSEITIDVLNIDDDLEALSLRSVLEYFGAQVNLYHIAKAQDLLDLFDSNQLSQHIVFMSHGTKQGMALPELAPSIAKNQPFSKFIKPEHIQKYFRFNKSVVINTGCDTASPKFTAAFKQQGCTMYFAPNGYPEGSSSLLYIIRFFYELIQNKLNPKQAHQKASSIDKETKLFLLHA